LYEGQLRLESNAQVDSLLFVKLAGKGIFPPNISVHPDLLSAVILHGDTLVQSLTIDNSTGGSKLDFSISINDGQLLSVSPKFSPGIVATTSKTTMTEPQPPLPSDIYQSSLETSGLMVQSEPVDIEEVLAILVDSIGSISEIIPNRFNFSEGESGSYIVDGGNDMYDWGNYLKTNIGGYIQYSNRKISTSQYLGNRKYFTLKGEGVFLFACDLKDVSYFEIDGNLGADGMGSVDGVVLKMKMGGNSYLGFVKRVYNAGDPSVNHLVIVQDNGSVNHSFSTNTDSDFHQILNLNGIGRLYYLLYAGRNGYYINDDHAMVIMEKFLSLVESNDWLTVDPLVGGVEAGESLLVEVKYDASDLYGGVYHKNLQIKSNDPINPMINVPVDLKVVGTPRLIVEEFYDSTSVVYWKSNAAASEHSFAPANNIPNHGILDITVHGNYAWNSQYADVYINDGLLNRINPTTVGTSTTRNILSHSDLQGYLANGSMTVRIANSYNVNFENRGEFHKVNLQLNYDADSVSFGELFIGDSIAKKLMIGNVGTDTLFLSLSSSADVFLPSLSELSIPAKKDTLINIAFIPSEPTDYLVDLIIRSNDPVDSLKAIKLYGLGLLPPILEVSVDSLSAVVLSGDTLAQEFTIGNTRGGNPLIYSIDIKHHRVASDSTNEFDPDVFVQKKSSPSHLTCIVSDPTTGLIYGQEINGDGFYRYNPYTDIWNSLAKQPLTTAFGGAVYHKEKIYTTSNNAYSLGIYDIKANSWETYYHGTIFSGIATDGEFLYMMRNNNLYRFNPNNHELAHLSSSPGYPGFKVNMGYHDGHLYVLSCMNNVFLKYDIQNDSWISFQDCPLTPIFGPAMDYDGNFYSFGYDTNYSSNLLVFNSYTEKWDIKNNPLFNVSDGGMTFIDHKHIYGLYFVEGSYGNGLGFHQTDRSGNWLSCQPVKDTLPEGVSSDLTTVYRTVGMIGGKYFAEIVINNNDPLNKQFSIPVTLEVVGAPNIFTSTDTVVFDTTFVGYSAQQSFVVMNSGTDTLYINSIALDNDDFAIDSMPALILPRNSSVINMTFSPSGNGLRSGTIEILNNDINKSPYHIKVFGEGLFPPEIAVDPHSMLVTLYSTDSLTTMLHVSNNGRSDLHMDISIVSNLKGPASHLDAGAFMSKLSALGGYDIVNNENGTIGYHIEEKVKGDSSENTISIHRIATLNNDLANVKVLFTDNRYNSFRITLESMGAKTYVYSNTIIPGVLDTMDVLVINDYLYPYTSEIKAIKDWVAAGGSLFIDGYNQGYYYNQILSEGGIRYVYNNIYYDISNDITRHFITREIQQYEVFYSPLSIIANKGAIDLVRDSRDRRSCLAIDTIGRGRVLASTGDSFMYSYFYSIGHEDVAINAIKWLSGKDISWLKTGEYSHHVAEGSSVQVPIIFVPKGLYSGTYNSHITIASNDPVTNQVAVPIEMTVIGVPEISTCDSVVFENVFVGQTGVHLLNVMNRGTGILTISEFLVDQPFVVNSDPFSIQPEDYALIPIYFMPGAHGSYNGLLTLKTNQRDSLKIIYLSGLAFDPPEIRLNVDSIHVNMTVNSSEKYIMTIANNGASDLTYSIIKENIGILAISPEFSSGKEGAEYVQVPERETKSAGNIAGEPKLEEILKHLSENVAKISDAIPKRYDFTEGVDGFYILDGGNDMYDVGNLFSTDRGGYVYYSDRAIRVDGFFGYPGNYFTFKDKGVFILAADIDIKLFDINGDLGADGFGNVNGAVYNMKKNGLNYLAFVKRVYEAWGKPSVNHMIIVQDNGKVGHEFSIDTNNDYHRVNNLMGIKRMYYLLFAGSGGHYFDDAACKKIMETFLDVAIGSDWLTVDKETGKVKPGSSENIEITLTSNELGCGLYQKVLKIFSNDPVNELITFPVDMNVYSHAIKITASPQAICEGGKATLSASGGKSYIWNTGSLSKQIEVKPITTTTYSVMGYDFNGCIAKDSFNLKVNPVPKVNLGSDTTVSISQRLVGTPFILKAGENYVSYIWSDGSTSSKMEIELNKDLPESKTYWVKVTDANNCVGGDTVNIRFELITNIDNREKGLQAELYPNPTDHYLTLKPAFASQSLYVEIRNLHQQLLFSREFDTLNLSEIRIDVSGLAAGIYIIYFESEEAGMGAKRFMVK
jgi:hypothetical protein